jgi:hypothetical protein
MRQHAQAKRLKSEQENQEFDVLYAQFGAINEDEMRRQCRRYKLGKPTSYEHAGILMATFATQVPRGLVDDAETQLFEAMGVTVTQGASTGSLAAVSAEAVHITQPEAAASSRDMPPAPLTAPSSQDVPWPAWADTLPGEPWQYEVLQDGGASSTQTTEELVAAMEPATIQQQTLRSTMPRSPQPQIQQQTLRSTMPRSPMLPW